MRVDARCTQRPTPGLKTRMIVCAVLLISFSMVSRKLRVFRVSRDITAQVGVLHESNVFGKQQHSAPYRLQIKLQTAYVWIRANNWQ